MSVKQRLRCTKPSNAHFFASLSKALHSVLPPSELPLNGKRGRSRLLPPSVTGSSASFDARGKNGAGHSYSLLAERARDELAAAKLSE